MKKVKPKKKTTVKKRAPKTRSEKNLAFPGLPEYKGPNTGYFLLLHHSVPLEYSHNVKERIKYVKEYKDNDQIPIRLRHMMYVDPSLLPDEFGKLLPDIAKTSLAFAKAKAEYEKGYSDKSYKKKNIAYSKRAPYVLQQAKLVSQHRSLINKLIQDSIPNCKWDSVFKTIQFYN